MFHSCVVDKINEFAYSFVWLSSGVVVVGGGGGGGGGGLFVFVIVVLLFNLFLLSVTLSLDIIF